MTLPQNLLNKLKTRGANESNHISWLNEKVLKHEEDQKEKKINLSGFTITYKRPYELLHTYQELFEKQIYRFHTATDRPIIIDCGANIGLSVLYFKKCLPNADIIAFEPDASNFTLLEKNVYSNNLASVTLHNAAIWIHNNSINFDASGSEASHISEQPDSGSFAVKAFRLADLLQQYPKVDFLKIDIEGAEKAVLQDAAHQLTRIENMFVEYHGKTNETEKLASILSIIEKAGFSTYIQNAADNLVQPYISKTTSGLYDVQLNIFCFKNKKEVQ